MRHKFHDYVEHNAYQIMRESPEKHRAYTFGIASSSFSSSRLLTNSRSIISFLFFNKIIFIREAPTHFGLCSDIGLLTYEKFVERLIPKKSKGQRKKLFFFLNTESRGINGNLFDSNEARVI